MAGWDGRVGWCSLLGKDMIGTQQDPIQGVIIGYQPRWKKWPDSADMNYGSVFAERLPGQYGKTTVSWRYYPAHRPYTLAGVLSLPVQHPFIANTLQPPQAVLDAFVAELESLARDGVTLVLWEHAYQCYPPVAQHLKRLFKHSILLHGDDAPGSTEIKTAPIAKYFDSVVHGNLVWHPNGETTAALYNRLGVADTHYVTLYHTCGLLEGLAAGGFNLEGRIAQLHAGAYQYDFGFVGSCMGPTRAMMGALGIQQLLRAAGIRSRMHGHGMWDGPLPRDLAKPGLAVAPIYLASFSVLNLPYIGVMSTRPFDAWMSGTLLIQQDIVGEMAMLGIMPGEHYASYDGSVDDLIRVIRYYQAHFDETEKIIRAGYALAPRLIEKYNLAVAVTRIFEKFGSKWE